MEAFWLQQIKLWLLEHASKYDMNDVIKYILKDKSTMKHLCGNIPGLNADREIQPTYLFLLLLKNLRESLKRFQPPDSSCNFCWDKEALSLIIDLLDSTYKQKPFVNFNLFVKLLKLLKLMEIFRMVYENINCHYIVQRLNSHFPRWNPKSKENYKKMYGSVAEAHLELLQETNSETRKFILKLQINDSMKKKYIDTNYAGDLKKMVDKTIPLLDTVIDVVKKLIGPSTVEQFISCSDEDFDSSNDPATQIVLEYLKPDMTEDEFLELLKILELPGSQEDTMNLCFGSPSPIDPFLNVDDNCDTQGRNELTFNVADDDTPSSSSDSLSVVPSTVNKQYGPLGLGPPSAKKTDTDEVSEMQAPQEHMELILDSEEEEQH